MFTNTVPPSCARSNVVADKSTWRRMAWCSRASVRFAWARRVLSRRAKERFARVRLALVRSARNKLAEAKLAPWKLAPAARLFIRLTPGISAVRKSARCKEALATDALVRSAFANKLSVRSAWLRFAWHRRAPDRFAPLRLADDRSAPSRSRSRRSAPERSSFPPRFLLRLWAIWARPARAVFRSPAFAMVQEGMDKQRPYAICRAWQPRIQWVGKPLPASQT